MFARNFLSRLVIVCFTTMFLGIPQSCFAEVNPVGDTTKSVIIGAAGTIGIAAILLSLLSLNKGGESPATKANAFTVTT